MFGKLFGKRSEVVDEVAQKAALLDTALEAERAKNPMAPLKIGAQEITEMLLSSMKDDKGVHVESLLAVLGSLGGFCCVDSTLKQAAALHRSTRECGIVDIETSSGERFFTGDPINHLLAESETSLWALVAGMINHLGSEAYPDVGEIAGYVVSTFGNNDFGRPRLPENHQPSDLPINYVRALWPHVLPHVEKRAPGAKDRVLLFGF
ncbi:MAG: hypothetical protein ACOYLK_15460, partial [Sphingomonas sp.]